MRVFGDSLFNGWKVHHTADLVVDIATPALEITATALEWTTLVGWMVGGSLFLANAISEVTTNKSLTENIFDK